jgi:hypothetical protein
MADRLVGVADNSANPLAIDSLVHAERIAFVSPTATDRTRSRWARAEVVLAGEADRLVCRRDGVAIVSVDPSEFDAVFELVPDPVVIVIAPAGTALPSSDRFVLVPRYAGCCYSIRIPERGGVVVTELSRPPRRPRRERRRRSRSVETEAATQAATEPEAVSPDAEPSESSEPASQDERG